MLLCPVKMRLAMERNHGILESVPQFNLPYEQPYRDQALAQLLVSNHLAQCAELLKSEMEPCTPLETAFFTRLVYELPESVEYLAGLIESVVERP